LGYNDGTVQVYELSSGRLLTYSSYQTTGAWSSGKQRPVQSIAWSLDGSRIVSSSADGTVVVRDTAFDQPLLSYPGRGGGLQSVALSPNGENLASFGLDSTVRVSNAFTGVPVFTYHGHRRSVRVVAWSPDGKYIASAGDEVHIWQAR